MWVPKTNEELEIKKGKNYSLKDILIGIAVVYLLFLCKIIFHHLVKYGEFKVDKTILITALLTPIFGILLYKFIGLFYKKQNSQDEDVNEKTTVVCINCNKLKSFDRNMICDCGGRFELLRKLKWVE